jgi:hypothetical protein
VRHRKKGFAIFGSLLDLVASAETKDKTTKEAPDVSCETFHVSGQTDDIDDGSNIRSLFGL